MKYVISVFYDDAEVDVKTNDVEIAILEMLKADKTGNHAHVCDGNTGEVLALVNSPDGERYCTEEFALMTLGFLTKCERAQAEEEEVECVDCEPEVEREVIPTIFEVMSALCGQLEVDMGMSHEDALGFPFVVPTPNESEIVS